MPISTPRSVLSSMPSRRGSLEREKNRVFPHDQVRLLNDAGFGTVRIPNARGGFGASL
jgi:hypothetical protein